MAGDDELPTSAKDMVAKSLKSMFLRRVGMLTGGTLFAHGLLVLATPLLTRLYSPDAFGQLAIYVAILSMAGVVSTMRIEVAIPLPRSDALAMNLLAAAILASVGLAVASAGLIAAAGRPLALSAGMEGFARYLWFVPPGILFAGWYMALQYWGSRQKWFGLVTRTRISRGIGGVGAQVALGFVGGIGAAGLIFGHMLYASLGVFGLMRAVWTRQRQLLRAIRLPRIGVALLRYRRFPVFSMPEAAFNTAGIQIPILLIAAADPVEGGLVLLAMRILGLPMALVGSSIAQVFLSDAAEKHRAGTLRRFVRRAMISLFIAGGIPLAMGGAVSPGIFGWMFGSEWAKAGEIVLWLTPWFILQLVTSPISTALYVTGNNQLAMLFQLFGAVLKIGALVWALVAGTDLVLTFAIASAVFYAAYALVILNGVGGASS